MKSITNGPGSRICGEVLGDVTLGSIRSQGTHIVLGARASKPHEFRVHGQVGQESHLHPAVVETPSGVSGGCRTPPPQAALPDALWRQMSPSVAERRQMSPSVAVCRRSPGQVLGQPLPPQALFFLLCVASPRHTLLSGDVC
jgi:hypothetical protein